MYPALIGVGDHLIGVDIELGIYVFATTMQIPPVDSCYWEVGNVSLLRDRGMDVFEMLRQRSIQGGRGIASTPDLRFIYEADGAPPYTFIEAREGDIWFRIWAEDRDGNRVDDTESCKAHLVLPSENKGDFHLKNGTNVIDNKTPPGLYVSTFSGDFKESCYYGWIDRMGGIEMYDSQRNVSRGASAVGYVWEDKGFAFVPPNVLYTTVSGCENEPQFYATHTEVGEALAVIYLEFRDTIERMQAAAPAKQVQPAPTSDPETVSGPPWDSPPEMVIDTSKSYSAVFELEKGERFEVELYADKVPRVVNNFVFLAHEGFYDGVTFHRVLEGFMAQTGDPTGTGIGGPGYRFKSEFHPDLSHDSAGILSMANAGGLDTNGSQFFITFRETAFLDHLNPDGSEKDCSQRGVSCHSVFGKVTSGLDVVNNITLRDPSTAIIPGDVITTIRIVEE